MSGVSFAKGVTAVDTADAITTGFTPSNYTPTDTSVKGSLQGIDTALGAISAGDVSGPVSSTDNALARWDGTNGQNIQNSLVIVDDLGNVTGCPTINIPTTASSSVGVIKQNNSTFIHSFGTRNIFLGGNSGNFTLNNPAGDNISVGNNCLQALTFGSLNVALGSPVLNSLTTGGANIAIGGAALGSLTTGDQNVAIGISAGVSYTGDESNNINISNPGVVGESNICRIGNTGSGPSQQTDSYIAGKVHCGTDFVGTIGATTAAAGTFTSLNASAPSFTGALNMNSHLINNVTDPVSAQDAATKNYVNFTPQEFALTLLQNSSTNFTTNNAGGFITTYNVLFQGGTAANGDYIDWGVPGTPAIGQYRVDFTLFCGGDTGIIDFSYKANGAGGYTNLKTGIDTYTSSNQTLIFTYYFAVTSANSINLRWTCNGKNASSSNFLVILGSFNTCSTGIRITRIL